MRPKKGCKTNLVNQLGDPNPNPNQDFILGPSWLLILRLSELLMGFCGRMTLRASLFGVTWPRGRLGSRDPLVARTRRQWSACRAHTAPVDRRSRVHSSYGLQVACARLQWSACRARTAPVVRMSRAHGSSGRQVARARPQWSAGRARTALVVHMSCAHGFSGPQVARALL